MKMKFKSKHLQRITTMDIKNVYEKSTLSENLIFSIKIKYLTIVLPITIKRSIYNSKRMIS